MKETYTLLIGHNNRMIFWNIQNPEKIYPVDIEFAKTLKGSPPLRCFEINKDFTIQWRNDGISCPVDDDGVKKDYKGNWYAVPSNNSGNKRIKLTDVPSQKDADSAGDYPKRYDNKGNIATKITSILAKRQEDINFVKSYLDCQRSSKKPK